MAPDPRLLSRQFFKFIARFSIFQVTRVDCNRGFQKIKTKSNNLLKNQWFFASSFLKIAGSLIFFKLPGPEVPFIYKLSKP